MWFLTVFGLMCELGGDLRVVLAVRDQLQHLELAVGELGADRLGAAASSVDARTRWSTFAAIARRDQRLADRGGTDAARSAPRSTSP